MEMDTSLSRESARPTHLRPRRRRLTDYKVRTPRMPPGPALKYGKRKAAGSRTPAAAPSPSNMPPEPAWPKPYGFIRDGTSRRCARVPCRALRLRSARRAINAAGLFFPARASRATAPRRQLRRVARKEVWPRYCRRGCPVTMTQPCTVLVCSLCESDKPGHTPGNTGPKAACRWKYCSHQSPLS